MFKSQIDRLRLGKSIVAVHARVNSADDAKGLLQSDLPGIAPCIEAEGERRAGCVRVCPVLALEIKPPIGVGHFLRIEAQRSAACDCGGTGKG